MYTVHKSDWFFIQYFHVQVNITIYDQIWSSFCMHHCITFGCIWHVSACKSAKNIIFMLCLLMWNIVSLVLSFWSKYWNMMNVFEYKWHKADNLRSLALFSWCSPESIPRVAESLDQPTDPHRDPYGECVFMFHKISKSWMGEGTKMDKERFNKFKFDSQVLDSGVKNK